MDPGTGAGHRMTISTPLVPRTATPAQLNVPVLIVDDNAAKRLAMKSVLLPLGYTIVEADSGVAALRCVMAQDFAVILLDVCMPITDGFQTAGLIRQRRESEWTPIIFITGYANDELTTTDHYAQGAVDFIFAPVPPDELRSKVAAFAKLFLRARKLAARALDVQASADQLRRLTEAAPIGIFQTDAENRYVYTNPRWTEICGVTAAQANGRRLGSLLETKTPENRLSYMANPELYDGELGRRVEIQVQGPSPARRIVLITSAAIRDGDGKTLGWVGTVADVTAEAGAETAMSAARDAAVAANAMQRNFAASASHELRTPTTSILGYTEEVLESETLSKQDREFLEVVYRNAQRLSQLIDDLLILDQAEIGPAMMHIETAEIAPLVDEVIETFSAAVQRADITLVAAYGADAPLAMVDPHRFEQALTNLIGNAVKFTPNGGNIRVEVRRSDDTVEVVVADTGTGIDPADIDHIFGRFYRAKTAHDSTIKGSGLGLAIAKRMIEAQDGQLTATSELGRGSTFTITVPVATRELQRA
jgi:PAS domain S-box-containing protein